MNFQGYMFLKTCINSRFVSLFSYQFALCCCSCEQLWYTIMYCYVCQQLFNIFLSAKTDERRGWDSNPRALADKRFSRPPRYDHFDTSAQYLFDTKSILTSALLHVNLFFKVFTKICIYRKFWQTQKESAFIHFALVGLLQQNTHPLEWLLLY